MVTNPIQLKTHITGQINSSPFSCTEDGEWNEGRCTGPLIFDRPLVGFSVIGCKTWRCKHHKFLADMESGNPLTEHLVNGGKVFDRTIIQYPYENSLILMSSVAYRPSPNEQHVYQTRVGTYTGPIDFVKTFPAARRSR